MNMNDDNDVAVYDCFCLKCRQGFPEPCIHASQLFCPECTARYLNDGKPVVCERCLRTPKRTAPPIVVEDVPVAKKHKPSDDEQDWIDLLDLEKEIQRGSAAVQAELFRTEDWSESCLRLNTRRSWKK